MAVTSTSSECHERIRRIVEGLEGVQQIKDDIVVHGVGWEHNIRLEKLLVRLDENGITLRLPKCDFELQEVTWFGHLYNKQGMSIEASKKEVMENWMSLADKGEVKNFLQTVQFN